MSRLLSALMTLILMVAASSCGGPKYVDYFPYHDDGTPKPRVALLPVIDHSNSGLSWSVSEALTESIYYDLMDQGELYVLTPAEVGPVWTSRDNIDFFGTDLCFVRDFCNTDFIVAMELIEHSTVPCHMTDAPTSTSECHPYNSMVSLRMRVRVIDIRRPQPRVVLYEIVKSSFIVTPPYDKINYNEVCYGSPTFSTSPYGIAHQRLVKNLTCRLENVLWSAR